MNFLSRAFASVEVKAALGVLDEAAHRYRNREFSKVYQAIEAYLLKKSAEYRRALEEKGGTPREWVYAQICNVSGDMLESGRYHIYRGLLDPTGESVLAIFNDSIEQLVQMKAIDPEYAREQKTNLSAAIARAG